MPGGLTVRFAASLFVATIAIGCSDSSSETESRSQEGNASTTEASPDGVDDAAADEPDLLAIDYAALQCPTPQQINSVLGQDMNLVVTDDPTGTPGIVDCQWTGPGAGEYAHRFTLSVESPEDFGGYRDSLIGIGEEGFPTQVLRDEPRSVFVVTDRTGVNGALAFVFGAVQVADTGYCSLGGAFPGATASVGLAHLESVASFLDEWCRGERL